jgi:hypothetical protein
MKLRKLLDYLYTFNADDEVVMETIDLDTGDTYDLYPFYVYSVMLNEHINEIRICQMREEYFEP